jgi:hypothetical protein
MASRRWSGSSSASLRRWPSGSERSLGSRSCARRSTDATVVREAETQFNYFLNQVAEQLRRGVRFTGQVFPSQASPTATTGTEMGGREKERRS